MKKKKKIGRRVNSRVIRWPLKQKSHSHNNIYMREMMMPRWNFAVTSIRYTVKNVLVMIIIFFFFFVNIK